MQGSSCCLLPLKVPNKIVDMKALPWKLLLQMDNCIKDNKNYLLLGFLSLLTTREVFKEVQLRFFVVGHTHESIDGSFGYLSKKLREQNNYVMADLMKVFMLSQDRCFILQLIKKLPNFKSWVNGFLNDGLDILVGHMDVHLFQLFVDESSWPSM